MNPAATKRPPIIVACAFDDQLAVLSETALAVGRLFEREVHFVHAFEGVMADPILQQWASHELVPSLYSLSYERILAERRQLLADKVQKLAASGAQVSGTVEPGEAAAVVLAAATAQHSPLIITACRTGSYDGLVPKAHTTALGLMADSAVPVLVVNTERRLDLERPQFRIMVGDDLEENSHDAVQMAYRLIALTAAGHLLHAHLYGDVEDVFADSWRELSARLPAMKQRYDSAQAYWQDQLEERRRRLAARAFPLDPAALARGVQTTIAMRAVHRPFEELLAWSQEFAPDLLIFGRHRFMKRRPFLIGRIPYRAMLSMTRPVLIVPPEAATLVQVGGCFQTARSPL